jgi:DNA repair protein REV1
MAEEVSRRLNAINMCGRSLTLKIMKRDPSAPVEAPKVARIVDTFVPVLTDVLLVVHGAWHL